MLKSAKNRWRGQIPCWKTNEPPSRGSPSRRDRPTLHSLRGIGECHVRPRHRGLLELRLLGLGVGHVPPRARRRRRPSTMRGSQPSFGHTPPAANSLVATLYALWCTVVVLSHAGMLAIWGDVVEYGIAPETSMIALNLTGGFGGSVFAWNTRPAGGGIVRMGAAFARYILFATSAGLVLLMMCAGVVLTTDLLWPLSHLTTSQRWVLWLVTSLSFTTTTFVVRCRRISAIESGRVHHSS